jgi:hypothetical protein
MASGYTHQSAVAGGPGRYFNPAAFVLQPAGTLGNLGRGALIGPNLRTFDLSFAKNNRWGEDANIGPRRSVQPFQPRELRPARFDRLHGRGRQRAAAVTFGRIRSTVTSARQISSIENLILMGRTTLPPPSPGGNDPCGG